VEKGVTKTGKVPNLFPGDLPHFPCCPDEFIKTGILFDKKEKGINQDFFFTPIKN